MRKGGHYWDQGRSLEGPGGGGGKRPPQKLFSPPPKKNFTQYTPVVTSEFILHFNWHRSNNWPN